MSEGDPHEKGRLNYRSARNFLILSDIAQLLTRGTIWIAIAAYVTGLCCLAQNRSKWLAATRVAWTIGCVALIAHFLSAFHHYHDWSQASAYRDTARQTEEVIGLNWGGGLFINYAVLCGWTLDVGWWWLKGIDSYRSRRLLGVLLWHGFLIFIIFNATVIFKAGIVRWIGLAVTVCLTVSWIQLVRRRWTRAD